MRDRRERERGEREREREGGGLGGRRGKCVYTHSDPSLCPSTLGQQVKAGCHSLVGAYEMRARTNER